MLFLGTFDYAMDERGRLPLPPDYRGAFRDGIVLSQGSPDLCLRAYTTDAFEAQASAVMAEPALHSRGRAVRLAVFSRCHRMQLDKQNRILIPPSLRDYARLSGKVLVAGNGEYFEIWAPEVLESQMARVDEGLEAMLDSMQARG